MSISSMLFTGDLGLHLNAQENNILWRRRRKKNCKFFFKNRLDDRPEIAQVENVEWMIFLPWKLSLFTFVKRTIDWPYQELRGVEIIIIIGGERGIKIKRVHWAAFSFTFTSEGQFNKDRVIYSLLGYIFHVSDVRL